MFHRHGSKNAVVLIIIGILILTLTGEAFVRAQSNPPPAARYTGSKVLLQGQVVDTSGVALPGVAVEIWQADNQGNYRHSADSDPSSLLEDFQYFGTATTDDKGEFAFLTLKPAPVDTRPAQVHFKVKMERPADPQFYFDEDRAIKEGHQRDDSSLLAAAWTRSADDGFVSGRDIVLT
jgi:protocatechuate 3,4-dioxygenase beta subunit